MTWRITPARDAFPSFAGEWDRLNREFFNGHPLLDSRFVGTLLEVFADGREFLCIHDTGIGVDGALIVQPCGAGRWTSFLPAQTQIGPLLMRQARPLETLFLALPGYVWSIDLLAVDPDLGPDWAGFRAPRRTMPYIDAMSVDLAAGFDTYWQARSKQLQQDIARYQRGTKAQDTDGLVDLITGKNAIADAFERYAALESSGWKGPAGMAVRVGSIQCTFYAKLLERFAESNDSAISEFKVGQTVAASRLMIRNRNYWIMLKTTYDESLAALAPSRQHLFELLRDFSAMENAVVVDFCTNASHDQARWATRRREIAHHRIYRNSAVAGLHTLVGRRSAVSAQSASVGERHEQIERESPVTVDAFASVDALPADVAELLDASGDPESTSAWFTNLQTTVFSNDDGVRHYVSRRGERVTAYLPLRHSRRGAVRQIDALGNYYTSLFGPAMSADAGPLDLAAIIALAAGDNGPPSHTVRLEPMDPESLGCSALRCALWSVGWIPFSFFRFGNWYLRIDGNYDKYLKSRSGSLRGNIKRARAKFAVDGGTFEIFATADQLSKGIDSFIRIYNSSWKEPEPYPDFVPGLMRWLAASGQLRLGVAYIAEQPIAAQLWFVHNNRAFIYKVAYDERFKAYSPGTLVSSFLMEHVINCDKVTEVDFGIGDDDYKRPWMSHRRERLGIVAYNPRTCVGAVLLVRETMGRIIRSVAKGMKLRGRCASSTSPVD